MEETVMEEAVVGEEKKKTKKTLWIILGIAIVLLLAGAALVGGRMLAQGQVAGTMNEINFVAASELPTQDPEARGMVTEIGESGSLFVQEFSMNDSLGLKGGQGGVMVFSSEAGSGAPAEAGAQDEKFVTITGPGAQDGPITEVVISQNTKIYKDITAPVMVSSSEGGPQSSDTIEEIKQEVKPGELSEITKNTMITIWGERKGERLVADVILYQNISMMEPPLSPE